VAGPFRQGVPKARDGESSFSTARYTPKGARVISKFARPLVLSLLPLLIAASASAAALSGRVVDPDGRPVPGATVILVGEGQPVRTAVTNQLGEFSIEAPDARGFDLRIGHAGFRGEVTAIDASQSRNLGDIRLVISAVTESVVVSAAQVDLPLSRTSSTVTVITGEELEARQVHSVADALRSVPGLAVVATGGTGAVTGVFPRGGESNFTLVFVDDVPVTTFGGEFDFGHLSTENVERIEVVRGPQSALFGSNAIGAVVRVVTRRGGAPAISGGVETGGYDTFRVNGATSGSAGRFEWGAGGERLTSDGFNGRRTAAGLTVENDDYSRASGSVSAGWRDDQFLVRGQLRHSVDERGVPGPFGSNPIFAYTAIDTVTRGENEQTIASISAAIPLAKRARAVLQTGYHRLESDFLSSFGPSESSSRRWSGRAQVDFPLTRALDMSAGAELQREQAGSTFIVGSSFEPEAVKRTIVGYFTEARWTAASRVFVTGGVRIDDIGRDTLGTLTEDNVVSINPRFGVAWLVGPSTSNTTKLRLAASTGIRPPGAFDIAFTDNPALEPERSRSVEAGIEQGFAGGRGLVEAVAFANEFDDLIVAVGSFRESSRYTTDNIANARARGIELGLGGGRRLMARLPIDLRGRLAYTFLDSEVLAVDRDDKAPPPFTVGEPLLRRPRHQFSAELTATSGRLAAFVSGGARSRVLDVEPSLGTFGGLHYAPGFNTWNAGASWRISKLGDIYARVENMFDEAYEEALGFPALGRRATVGLRVAAGR
jgi:outer membrane cobalamin receptor